MALYNKFFVKTIKSKSDILKTLVAYVHKDNWSQEIIKDVKQKSEKDLPVEMENPFVKEQPKCLLCQLDLDPSYKNVRLLSQFVSKYTGRIYGRHITGLCSYRHKQVEEEIKKAQMAGLMGTYVKNPNYLNDPSLYDPRNPLRPHSY